MSNEIYIAKQETLLETKTKVEAVQNKLVETETKVGAVQNTLSETETKVEAVQNTLGKTNDSGGTTTTGTVVAKENAILTEVNKIGNSTDTGATATTGTVMGKLNGLFNKNNGIDKKIFSENDIIMACTNLTTFSVNSVTTYETEIFSVTGSGAIEYLYLNTPILENTATMKVYVDGELFLNFSSSANKTKRIAFGYSGSGANTIINNLTEFKTPSNTEQLSKFIPNLLYFTSSLRIVLTVTRTGNYTSAMISYGLR